MLIKQKQIQCELLEHSEWHHSTLVLSKRPNIVTSLIINIFLMCSGYMSPEYAMDGIFSAKSDVFSFGVLVLEIISGKKNRGFYYANAELNLLGHVCGRVAFISMLHS